MVLEVQGLLLLLLRGHRVVVGMADGGLWRLLWVRVEGVRSRGHVLGEEDVRLHRRRVAGRLLAATVDGVRG